VRIHRQTYIFIEKVPARLEIRSFECQNSPTRYEINVLVPSRKKCYLFSFKP